MNFLLRIVYQPNEFVSRYVAPVAVDEDANDLNVVTTLLFFASKLRVFCQN